MGLRFWRALRARTFIRRVFWTCFFYLRFPCVYQVRQKKPGPFIFRSLRLLVSFHRAFFCTAVWRCVALAPPAMAKSKNNHPCLIPKTPTSHGPNAENKSDRERGREERESAVCGGGGGGARAARARCVHANARDAHARVVELESLERDEDRQHTTLEQCISPPPTAQALSWAVLTSTDRFAALAIISRCSSHPLPADRSPHRLPLCLTTNLRCVMWSATSSRRASCVPRTAAAACLVSSA